MPVLLGAIISSNQQARADTGAMFPIFATTVGISSGVSSVTFSNIPQTYKHLQIRGILKSNRTGSDFTGHAWLQINGSFGVRYHVLAGVDGNPTVLSGVPSFGNGYQIAATGSTSAVNNMFGACIIDLLEYTSTNKNKTIRTFSGADTNTTGGMVVLTSYLVDATSAITSISIGGADSTNILQYSSFALYGIKGV